MSDWDRELAMAMRISMHMVQRVMKLWLNDEEDGCVPSAAEAEG